ncbi:uncharacterized protein LOC109595118 [Aethina tumida]|uniref:uncharacterized protein LOC109595118 n=1 Tax=Aethina tumida TaxID=116153 RepID=UPI00096B0AF8|nr:uncharacterized protein LOC109595118 [Aethina tumida]
MKRFILSIYILACAFSNGFAAHSTTKATSLRPNKEDAFKEDMKTIFAMIPKEKFHELAFEHAKNDTGFQAALRFFKGDQWTKAVERIKANPDWIEFKAFLSAIGVDMEVYLRCIEAFLEKADVPGDLPDDAKKDLKPFLADLEKHMPTAKILAKLNERIMNNPHFHEIYEKLASEKSHAMVEKARAIPEFKFMVDALDDMGIQVKEIINALYVFLGWE